MKTVSVKRILAAVFLAVLLTVSLTLTSCMHVHAFGNEWKANSAKHWLECSCGEKKDVAEHVVNKWTIKEYATANTEGVRYGNCVVCKSTVTQKYSLSVDDHVHDFGTMWFSDNSQHWKQCNCGAEIDRAAHQTGSWTVEKEATADTEGLKSAVCDICNKRITQVIPVTAGHKHSYDDVWTSDSSQHWRECSCGEKSDVGSHFMKWVVDVPATTSEMGSKHQECVVCHKRFATERIPLLTSETRTVDFYAINDFHGAVDKMSRIGGYLTEQKNDNANTVLINSGDMFQGSIASNSNRGKLLSDCMAEIGFDQITFGNHEFDWGLDNLRNLANSSGVPFLGANIYNWNANTHAWGDFASDLAQKYVIKTLDNGLKVGIIGVIGQDQITSISSNLVQTIGFKDPLDVVPDLATELRNNYNCDIVVLSAHVGPHGLVGESSSNQKPSTTAGLENYVDAVFCAHTHQTQNYVVNGLPFIQGGSSGNYVSHIGLSVDSNGNVTCTDQQNIYYSNSWRNLDSVDQLIGESNMEIAEEANEELCYISQSLDMSPSLPRLACRAVSEFAVAVGHDDIMLAMINKGRADLPSGNVTYENLYKSLPFDNIIYIAEVSGKDLLKEASYSNNSIWRVSGEAVENSDSKFYKIAVIDYLLFHQNTNRNYDYFPSAFTGGRQPIALTPNSRPLYNYREITRDYMRSHDINPVDYTVSNNYNDNGLLSQAVTLQSGSGSGTVIGEGTRANPYTVKDALLLAATASEADSSPKGYVKGTVKYLANKISDKSGDMNSLYIQDAQGNSILVYFMSKHSDASLNDNWTSINDLCVGDEILIYAKSIYTYNGTPEIYQSYCVTINGVETHA